MPSGFSHPKRRKRARLYMVLVALFLLGLASFLVLRAFDDSLVFFISPSEAKVKNMKIGQRFRLGGLVEEGSVHKNADVVKITFRVTDFEKNVDVEFEGLVPDLFREVQGVVAEGYFNEEGIFIANSILAKHDENYMPPEVARALEGKGHPGKAKN